jgi:hypothetical protein
MMKGLLLGPLLLLYQTSPIIAQTCPDDFTIIDETVVVTEFPIFIDTFVDNNTVIVVNNGITINVTDAPTRLSVHTWGQSSNTITSGPPM